MFWKVVVYTLHMIRVVEPYSFNEYFEPMLLLTVLCIKPAVGSTALEIALLTVRI